MARDGVTVEIIGTEKIDQALKRLHSLSARKRDVTDVFRRSMKPLITAGKSEAPVKTGRLRRSIKFKTSKKYPNVWYVLAGSSKAASQNAYYAHMVGRGHKVRNGSNRLDANQFMDRAWNSTGNQVIKDLEDGLMNLAHKLWALK